MSGNDNNNSTRTINDVLRAIEGAKSTQYKNKDGLAYSSVPVKQLNRWALTIESELRDERAFSDGAAAELKEALTSVQQLTDAASRHEKVVDSLKDGIATAKANHLLAEEKLGKTIDLLRKQVKEAKEAKADAEVSKAETAKALKAAEASLTGPEAMFLPEAAVQLRNEIIDLKADLAHADSAIANERAAASAASKALDIAQKELAGARTAELEAVGKLATFERQNKGAAAGIKELFKVEDLDHDALTRVLGQAGVKKLRAVLSLDPTDLKGRLSKMVSLLNASIKSATAGFATYLKQLLGLINRTLQMIKNNGGSWVAVLAPWINGIIKDIAMLSTKSVTSYRQDLEARIAAAHKLPKNASIKEKVKAGNAAAAPQLPWKQVASSNISSTRRFIANLRTRFVAASKATAKFAKRVASFASRSVRGCGLMAWWTVRGTCRTLKRGAVWWYEACWTLGFEAACWFNGVAVTPPVGEKGKAVGRIFRSPYKGSFSYTEEDVLDPFFLPRPPTGASMSVSEYEDFKNSYVHEDDLKRPFVQVGGEEVSGIVMFDATAEVAPIEQVEQRRDVQLPGSIEPGPSYAKVASEGNE